MTTVKKKVVSFGLIFCFTRIRKAVAEVAPWCGLADRTVPWAVHSSCLAAPEMALLGKPSASFPGLLLPTALFLRGRKLFVSHCSLSLADLRRSGPFLPRTNTMTSAL